MLLEITNIIAKIRSLNWEIKLRTCEMYKEKGKYDRKHKRDKGSFHRIYLVNRIPKRKIREV